MKIRFLKDCTTTLRAFKKGQELDLTFDNGKPVDADLKEISTFNHRKNYFEVIEEKDIFTKVINDKKSKK